MKTCKKNSLESHSNRSRMDAECFESNDKILESHANRFEPNESVTDVNKLFSMFEKCKKITLTTFNFPCHIPFEQRDQAEKA